MERPDWEQAIKTPVGILPCGSGNALSGSINHYAGYEMYLSSPGTHCLKFAVLQRTSLIFKGTVHPKMYILIIYSPTFQTYVVIFPIISYCTDNTSVKILKNCVYKKPQHSVTSTEIKKYIF